MTKRKKNLPLIDFFWGRVRKSEGCWEWIGQMDGVGYGKIVRRKNGPSLAAHRTSWIIHNGEIPSGLFVCHHCDNRKCVRPDHLFLGTQWDNMQDAKNKGRSKHPNKAWRKNITHCSKGHEFSDENTYRWKNKRICRICHAALEAKRRERIKECKSLDAR